MQSPIPTGTSLQNRYRLQQILGQGGFGRTYLAEDRGRFDELCAIKEFIPSQVNPAFGEKARELFQREAAILYQIDHPQIPKFRAHFEQEGRLFLVQDYVAGKTYRKKLQERISLGETFSEAEIRHLMAKLLPVLDAIHHRGIIHRDISPENIIDRDATATSSSHGAGYGGVATSRQDRLGDPVLIDFGVGKELAAQANTTNAITGASLGKIGYAPSEQIQSGRAYPSSDLYALAVTAVVLLTGVEPQQLFDDNLLTWQWEKFLVQDVSPELTKILNRMLQLRPGDRYQTAKEVIAALAKTPSKMRSANPPRGDGETGRLSPLSPRVSGDGGEGFSGETGSPLVPWDLGPLVPPSLGLPNHPSGIPMAIEKPEAPEVPTIVAPKPSLAQSFWENNIAVAVLTVFLMALSGLGSWFVVRQLVKQQQNSPPVVEVEGTPELSDIPTIPTLPIPTAPPTGQPQAATPTTAPTPSTSPSPPPMSQSQKEEEEEPVRPSKPEPKPVFYNQPLEVDRGKPKTAQGNLKSHETIRYIVDASAGEQLSLNLSGDGVLMNVFAPNGKAVDDRAQWISQWLGPLPTTGQYTIEISPVYGLPDNNYKLDVLLSPSTITTATREGSGEFPPPGDGQSPNLGTDPTYLPPVLDSQSSDLPQSQDEATSPAAPIPATERLIFPAGQHTIAVSDRTAPQKPKRYLVYVEKGQTLLLSSKSGAIGLDVRYPNGQLIEDASMMVFWEGTVPISGEYQIDVVSDDAVNYTLEVTVK
ncbi:serine/threonine-protein kinase [[Phormidium] sp. ETS-05]|uniref:serine/threonine-protein kinase n=1 Tax=[Phormidium] sp. ETS-05 TaxID=222819 RepID=UPI0018EECC91|nr:serine/threonine-protein kinase [[Phormidium] sp. ETS-05]